MSPGVSGVICAQLPQDLRKLWAEWRAVHAPRRLKVFLQTTPGYDGLLKNFVCGWAEHE